MKAKLTFDLNDPDDAMAHMRAVKSLDMALMIWHLSNQYRTAYEKGLTIEQMSDTFNFLLDDYSINIEELIN